MGLIDHETVSFRPCNSGSTVGTPFLEGNAAMLSNDLLPTDMKILVMLVCKFAGRRSGHWRAPPSLRCAILCDAQCTAVMTATCMNQ